MRGVLTRVHMGVYVIAGSPAGHQLSVRAALAAVGPGSAASHDSAAWLYGMLERAPAEVHLTMFDGRRHRLRGVVVHRSRQPAGLRKVKGGILCTPPSRTLVDLATSVSGSELDSAIDAGLALRLVRVPDLERILMKQARPGRGQLAAALIRRGFIGGPSPSVLESRATRVIAASGLPTPVAEVIVGPDGQFRVDFAYPVIRLAIEVYGYAWHHTPEQMASDAARLRALIADGWTVLTFTWSQVVNDPEGMAREILAVHARLSHAA